MTHAKSACVLDLPIGPSVNNLYPGRGRRRKSQHYKRWLTAAGWEIKLQKPAPISVPFTLHLKLPLKMRGDVSNRLKAVEDLLVQHAITPDDRFSMSSTASRCESVPAGRCHVTVRPAS